MRTRKGGRNQGEETGSLGGKAIGHAAGEVSASDDQNGRRQETHGADGRLRHIVERYVGRAGGHAVQFQCHTTINILVIACSFLTLCRAGGPLTVM